MKVSGFTFVKNATKLYIPAKQAIASILPAVDEMIVAVGAGDPDDRTLEEIESLQSEKIKIIHTEWNVEAFPRNTVFAAETDKAMAACSGDWLFYIQCDEAMHEDYLPVVRKAMETYLNDDEVEGFLFKYRHFWGNYEHYNPSHAFYDREIRIIRNRPDIHSWKDAQSFRSFEDFKPDFAHYEGKEGTRKLRVVELDAEIYHYGWVRPPAMMRFKNKASSETYRGKEATERMFKDTADAFDYGPLNRFPRFKGSHPAVMKDWMADFHWGHQLRQNGPRILGQRPPESHETLKNRVVTWMEQHLFGGVQQWGFQNFIKLKRAK